MHFWIKRRRVMERDTMSKKQSLLAYIGALASLPAIGAMIFWLVNTEFVSAEELKPLIEDVFTLQADMRELKAGVELTNCLQLAEKRSTPWLECVRRHDAAK